MGRHALGCPAFRGPNACTCGAAKSAKQAAATPRPHDAYCWKCDMAEFAGITYEAGHHNSVSPTRCQCGVPVNVNHYCARLGHAWVGKREPSKGCLDHYDDPYPAGCPDCADMAAKGN